MRGIKPEYQPIEKLPPSAGPVEEDPIHRRRQPHYAEPLAECRLAAYWLAVDPYDSALNRRAISPSPDAQYAASRREGLSDGPAQIGGAAAGPGSTVDLGHFGAAQPTTRCQKGQRLQEIGLAGAVRPGKHHRLGAEGKPRLAIITKACQYEPRHADALRRGTSAAAGFLCLGQHSPVHGVKKALLPAFGPGAGALTPASASGRKARWDRRCRGRLSGSRHPTLRIVHPRP